MAKFTGIVRRIDDLGRVVIPKELRRRHHIEDGEALEIGEDGESLVLRKYSAIRDFEGTMRKIAECLSLVTGLPIAVCDTASVLYSKGCPELKDKNISEELYAFMKNKPENYQPIRITGDLEIKASHISLVYSDRMVIGALLVPNDGNDLSDAQLMCLKLCARAIGMINE